MSVKTNFEIENYKDIKNYIHNYLGLTKEEVRSIVDETVKDPIRKICYKRNERT